MENWTETGASYNACARARRVEAVQDKFNQYIFADYKNLRTNMI
jgi:hypothetical protein